MANPTEKRVNAASPCSHVRPWGWMKKDVPQLSTMALTHVTPRTRCARSRRLRSNCTGPSNRTKNAHDAWTAMIGVKCSIPLR